MIFSPIHHTFAPHVDSNYVYRCCALLLQPWRWKSGKDREELRSLMGKKSTPALFASGREALLALLRSMDLKEGDEIIIQGYTCVALPNAIRAGGGSPVYVDIGRETLNMDPDAVEAAITDRTRAIICQHTFGIPADTKQLREICDRHNLLLIEDCAHSIPDASGPHEIGKLCDALMMSFGRDKAISGVAGGAVASRTPEMAQRLLAEEKKAKSLSIFTIKRLLLYPVIYWMARPLYGMFIGKLMLYAFGKLRILVPVLTAREKSGRVPDTLHRMPNACAALLLTEWKNLKSKNDHRRELTKFYLSEAEKPLSGIRPDLPLQKFPLFTKNADGIRATLKKKNIHLDDGWTGCVVCPAGVDLAEADYVPGSDPKAEAAAEMILSLPTHPTMTMKQAGILLRELTPLLQQS